MKCMYANHSAPPSMAPLETPIKVEKYVVTKKALAAMGKEFKKDAKAVSEALTALDSDGLKALEAKAKAEGKASLKAGEQTFEISAELLQVTTDDAAPTLGSPPATPHI